MSVFKKISLVAVAAVVASAALAGCAANSNLAAKPAGEGASKTVTAGKLTIATGEPAYSPWVVDNQPESGKGFEAAVAYAVAEELGYAKSDVVWVRDTFEGSIAPGLKNWDLNLQQFSITQERKQAVDFSAPYYTSTQAVVAAAGTPAAAAKSLADLKDVVFGVTTGTTSLQVAQEIIAPTKQVQVFNNVEDNVQALVAGNIDAIVVDLPTAFFARDVQLNGKGVIVGQLAGSDGDAADEYGFVLPKGSALTADVDAALARLRANGKLEQIAQQWLADQGAPVLK